MRTRWLPAQARLLVPAHGTENCKQSSCCCAVVRWPCRLTDNGARRSSPPDDLKRSNKAGVTEGNGLEKLRHRDLGGQKIRFGSEMCRLMHSLEGMRSFA